MFRGTYDFESEPFDWGASYKRPDIPLKDLVIAELPVRLFTGAIAPACLPATLCGWAWLRVRVMGRWQTALQALLLGCTSCLWSLMGPTPCRIN